ncbi:MAG: hypothetical protein WCM76_12675 [Bacteroidota bacterium]
MGFDFKKIKGLFIQTVEEPTQKDAGAQNKNAGGADQSKDIIDILKEKPGSQQRTDVKPAGDGTVDHKILDSLLQAIEAKNMAGEDYLEYLDSLKAMQNIPLDEPVKIQTVLATLSTKGLTKQKIYDSAAFYLTILDDEKSKFYKALEKQTKDNVTAQKNSITALDELIKTKSSQIAQLTKEITAHQEEIAAAKTKITESESRIKNTENNFVKTWEFVAQQMKENVEKIKALDAPKN